MKIKISKNFNIKKIKNTKENINPDDIFNVDSKLKIYDIKIFTVNIMPLII